MDKHTQDLIKVLNAHADYFERRGRSASPIPALIILGLICYVIYTIFN